jgi:hypothetical protein
MFEEKGSIYGRLVHQLHAILRSIYMKAQENEITYRERLVEQRSQRNPRFAFILALLSLPLIIVGMSLLIFAGVTIAGVTLLVLTILLLIVGAGLLIAAGVYFVNSTVRVETRHFSVNRQPHIVVNNEVGTIHIKATSDANTVHFQTKRHTKRLGKSANESWVCYEQLDVANEIRAEVERVYSPNDNLPQSIDFNVTVPHNTDLEVITSVGDIWVTGIRGQLTLQSDIGSIYVREGLLSGNSMLKTSLGSVNFHEAIDPHGTYQFATETGLVNVILPDDTAFELDASTTFGNITTVVPEMKMAYRTNSEVHGDAGIPPRASMTLRSITGSVSVFEESDGHVPNWDES